MPQRWIFTEAPGRDGWNWRAISPDDGTDRDSKSFPDYGAMVHDAIKQGFQPSLEHWVVVSAHGTTHFEPGVPPTHAPAATPSGTPHPPEFDRRRKAAIERPDLEETGSEMSREPAPIAQRIDGALETKLAGGGTSHRSPD
jgi:hypothetical protein